MSTNPMMYVQIKNLDMGLSSRVDGQPLCYLFLGDRLFDVRGISEDNSRVSLKDIELSVTQTLPMTVQVKLPNEILGYLSVPLRKVVRQQDMKLLQWFPLKKDKTEAVYSYSPDRDHKEPPRILVQIRIGEADYPTFRSVSPMRDAGKPRA